MKYLDIRGDIIKHATSTLTFSDGGGLRHQVSLGQPNHFIELAPKVQEIEPGRWQINLRLRNISRQPLRLHELAVLDVDSDYGGMLNLQSLPIRWTVMGMQTTVADGGMYDMMVQRAECLKNDFYTADYMLVGNRSKNVYFLAGFLTFGRQLGSFRLAFDPSAYNFASFRAVCELDGCRLDAQKELISETLFLNMSDLPEKALADYAERVRHGAPRQPCARPTIGWGTWDYYFAKITEDDVLENARWLAKRRTEFPVEYIQLDDGFQKCEGDWLITNERFPHGLKWLAREIKKLGFKPALWLCPYLASRESSLYQKHPNWVIRDANGEPVRVQGYTTTHVYPLDCSLPAVRAWVREFGRTVVRDYGYHYIKLDCGNVRTMNRAGVLADRQWTKARAMHEGFKALRAGMGEKALLLGGCLFGQSIGIVDAMRVGGDVGARWDASQVDKHHGERDNYPGPGFVVRAIQATMNCAFQNGKWWQTDPDYLIVRPKGDCSELSDDDARTWASVVGLNGGLMILADRMTALPEERLDILRKVLPGYPGAARTVDFFKDTTPTKFSLAVENDSEQWHVAALINMRQPARIREEKLDFQELGLNPETPYHVFDFWAGKYRGIFKGGYQATLAMHQCRVLAIRAVTGLPQLVGTDLHITQGGVELKAARFDPKTGSLVVIPAAMSKKGHLYFYLPPGWQTLRNNAKQQGRILKLPITFRGNGQKIVIRLKQGA